MAVHAVRIQNDPEPPILLDYARTRSYARIRPVALANAAATVAAMSYLLCASIVVTSRELATALVGPWFHGMVLQAPTNGGLGFGMVVAGLVTLTVAVWLMSAVMAGLYNIAVQR